MPRRDKDYIFHASTLSLCPKCLDTLPAKVIIRKNGVYLLRRCGKHGSFETLREEDVSYYLSQSEYAKPPTSCTTQTRIARGCPRDCGLCPDHEQHTCIGLIDVTGDCDLSCPICYAGDASKKFLPLGRIERMIDFLIESENGQADIVQISGGEPTRHPRILDILRMARSKRVRYVMLNTNGVRIAEDESFARELGRLRGKFEVYLQFDGFKRSTYERLRRVNLLPMKELALRNLAAHQVPVTLVATIQKGTNDDEIGRLIDMGIRTKYIRGINFQPLAYYGRNAGSDSLRRITLTGIVNEIETQTRGRIRKTDIVPLPCHPDRMSMTYLYREAGELVPLTRRVDIARHLSVIRNSACFKPQDVLRDSIRGLWSFSTVLSSARAMKQLACCVPLDARLLTTRQRTNYVNESTFRISIVSFMDAWNSDLTSMKKECVHFITPDMRKIPFSAYNLLHRGVMVS